MEEWMMMLSVAFRGPSLIKTWVKTMLLAERMGLDLLQGRTSVPRPDLHLQKALRPQSRKHNSKPLTRLDSMILGQTRMMTGFLRALDLVTLVQRTLPIRIQTLDLKNHPRKPEIMDLVQLILDSVTLGTLVILPQTVGLVMLDLDQPQTPDLVTLEKTLRRPLIAASEISANLRRKLQMPGLALLMMDLVPLQTLVLEILVITRLLTVHLDPQMAPDLEISEDLRQKLQMTGSALLLVLIVGLGTLATIRAASLLMKASATLDPQLLQKTRLLQKSPMLVLDHLEMILLLQHLVGMALQHLVIRLQHRHRTEMDSERFQTQGLGHLRTLQELHHQEMPGLHPLEMTADLEPSEMPLLTAVMVLEPLMIHRIRAKALMIGRFRATSKKRYNRVRKLLRFYLAVRALI
mmetsp:Transcript_2695/g.4049  ORF Transcript_2695/g.4049 Transcript_2695/m.4049 type:complete len:407 (-) Transcript_2695:45-1265(-)